MAALAEGQKFERYRVLRRLGNGTSGESYEAEDSMLQRSVTLKLINPWSKLSDAARRQFFREMQSISTLTHPYLTTALDYGEVNGQLYIARNYVPAGSLLGNEGRLWYRPPLAIPDALHFTHQLAQALHHIHSYGYIHGSLTLSNILVLRSPHQQNELDAAFFLIADPSLAHFVRRFGQPPSVPFPITTAPEQLRKRVLPASDQYALAVLLYFWLTGRLPFLGTAEEIEQLKRSETISSLTLLNPKVTIGQEAIILRALSAYPEDRYPSLLAFANALLASLTPAAISDEQIAPISLTPEPVRGRELPPSEQITITATAEAPNHLEALLAQLTDFAKAPSFSEYTPQPDMSNEGVPLPPPAPDIPMPIPQPDPLPTTPLPQPLPKPEQLPEPETKPEPEVLPRPEPDIAQPLPDPTPSPAPEPLPPDTVARMRAISLHQEAELMKLDRTESSSAYLTISSCYTKEARVVSLKGAEITVGRAGSSDILLDQDTRTSRHQAMLKQDGNQYILYDRHSAYGTLVNGQKLSSEVGHILSNGDHITIGAYELTFHQVIGHSSSNEYSEQVFPNSQQSEFNASPLDCSIHCSLTVSKTKSAIVAILIK